VNTTPPDLARALPEWMHRQRDSVQYVYHPRRTDVSDFVRRKFLSDLLAYSDSFTSDARGGTVVCDLNVKLAKPGGRARKLDLILGAPLANVGEASGQDVLRKAKVAEPLLSLEVKLCMTEHRKATSRLIDELLASLEVVKSVAPSCACFGIVVVNVAGKFTSPSNLPGPNVHDRPHEIERLVQRVLDRVPIRNEGAYHGLAVTLISSDNERHFAPGGGIVIPPERSYQETLVRAAQDWESVRSSALRVDR
jgi:hypothetical protein